jgi:hypothetical protein
MSTVGGPSESKPAGFPADLMSRLGNSRRGATNDRTNRRQGGRRRTSERIRQADDRTPALLRDAIDAEMRRREPSC